jgi:hypothetical protein
MLSFAGNMSFENEEEKSKYIQARSPFIPAIKTPGAYAVDPNPKPNNNYVPGSSFNDGMEPATLAKDPDDDQQYPFDVRPNRKERK